MAAKTTIEAMIARFDSVFATSSIGEAIMEAGGLRFGEIPADKALPFVGLGHGGTMAPEYHTESDYTEADKFSFEVHDTSLVNAEGIGTEIKKAFDLPGSAQAQAALPMDDARVISCRRTGYFATVDPNDDPQGRTVYIVTVEYEVTVRKTLGVN